jgi:hypothetical protein
MRTQMRGNFDADQVFAPCGLRHRRTSTLDREVCCLEDVFEAMSQGEDMLGRGVQICLVKERVEERRY